MRMTVIVSQVTGAFALQHIETLHYPIDEGKLPASAFRRGWMCCGKAHALMLQGISPYEPGPTVVLDTLAKELEKTNLSDYINLLFMMKSDSNPTIVVTLCVENCIVFPDLLNNLTSFSAHPKQITDWLAAIQRLARFHVRGAHMLPQKRGWQKDQLAKHMMSPCRR